MFWKQARKQYSEVSDDDPDVVRYLSVAKELQKDGYNGILGTIQDIGHSWVARNTPEGKTLEIGFGAGRHSLFYQGKEDDYYVSDINPSYMESDEWKKRKNRAVCCDATKVPFSDDSFRSVISVYNLEHIHDLRALAREVHRILKPGGSFLVALPCEGGLLWNLGRSLTTRRVFSKKYNINYDKIIAYEHVWDYAGVCDEMLKDNLFAVRAERMFLLPFLSYHFNLVACLHYVAEK